MRAWLNGSVLTDPHGPALRIDDHGLTVGDGLFETMRVVDDVPFALTRHLARMTAGAVKLGLPTPDNDLIRGAIAEVLDGAGLTLGRVRVTYTGGPAPMGSAREDDVAPTLLITATPMSPHPPSTTAVRVPWVRNERSAVAGVKTISFAENVVALAHARRAGAEEAILANTIGDLCEGTGSNVGYVLDGRAWTPTLESGCLPGVTRSLLLVWCDVGERDAPLSVLDEASEVFLISTTRQVQPVRALDDRRFDVPGPVTSALMSAWADAAAARMDP